MIFRLVQNVDGQFITTDMDNTNVLAAMEVRGYTFTGYNDNPRHRPDLQGAPMFNGLRGPMWDGERYGVPVLRYECAETFARMSA